MKKAFLILAAFGLALASCSKQEESMNADRAPMDVSPVVTVGTAGDTRAVITGTTFPTTRSMVVSADLNSNTGSTGNYFTNLTFTYNSSVWAPANTYYWPLSGGLEILAYSAGSASVTPTWTNATGVSLACSDCTADDILMGGATNATATSKSVAFKHCLSQVKVTAKSSVASVIKIKSVSVNAKKGATLAISKSSGSAATTVATTLTGSASDVSVLSGGNVTLTTSAQNIGSAILLPAQTPASIKIGYTITNNSVESATMYVTKSVTTALVAGSAYTYAITATLTGLNVTATLTDWTDGSSTAVSI